MKAASYRDVTRPKNKTPRVFVLEEPSRQNVDISSGTEYGNIVPIFNPEESKKLKCFNNDYIDILIEKLDEANYNPTVDFLLICGHMPSIAILVGSAMREFVENEDEFIQILIWNSWKERYVPVEI